MRKTNLQFLVKTTAKALCSKCKRIDFIMTYIVIRFAARRRRAWPLFRQRVTCCNEGGSGLAQSTQTRGPASTTTHSCGPGFGRGWLPFSSCTVTTGTRLGSLIRHRIGTGYSSSSCTTRTKSLGIYALLHCCLHRFHLRMQET